MTLSLAYDGDLSYQRRDLERFWGIYKQGPEGIFLKKGKQFRLRVRLRPPFIEVLNGREDLRTDRLYFAKAMAYSVVAAPFEDSSSGWAWICSSVRRVAAMALTVSTAAPVPAPGTRGGRGRRLRPVWLDCRR